MRIFLLILLFSYFYSIKIHAQTPILTAQIGHEGRASFVCFSPDNELVATSGTDQSIKIWKIKGGKLLKTLDGHNSKVSSIAFSNDGNLLVSGSYDKTIKVWEVHTGMVIQTLTGHDSPINSVAFSEDGLMVASASGDFDNDQSDNSVRLWEVLSGKMILKLEGHEKSTNTVSFNSNGKYLVSGGWDNQIKLWSVTQKKLLRTYSGHTDRINTIKFCQDGMSFASCSNDQTIKTWDIISGEMIHDLKNNLGNINSFSYSSDGKFIVSGGVGKKVNLWRAETGKLEKTFNCNLGWVTSVAYNQEGEIIASGSSLDHTLILDVEKQVEISRLEGFSKKITTLEFSPDGKSIAFVNNGNNIFLIDVATGRVSSKLTGHRGYVRDLNFSADGKSLISVGADKSVKIWNLDKDGNPKSLNAHRKGLFSLAYNKEKGLIASGSGDGTVMLWELTTGRPLDTLIGNTKAYFEPAWSLDFSNDGKYLVSGGHNSALKVWQVENKACKPLNMIKADAGAIRAVKVSPDGQFIATAGGDHTIKVWSGGGRNLISELKGHQNEIMCLSYSPDGKYLVSGSRDKTIKIWDAQSGRLIKTLKGHTGDINALSFSGKGRFLVSGGDDSQLKLWDFNKMRELATFIISENEKDYVVITKRGYFEGTMDGIKRALHYVRGNEVIPLESYFEKFYTPELWSRIMQGEDPNDMDFDVAQFINIPADIAFVKPDKGDKNIRFDTKRRHYLAPEEKIKISAKVLDNGGGIDEVRFYQNGKLVYTTGTAFKNKIKDGEEVTVSFEPVLIDGLNEFTTMAFNNERTESLHDLVSIFHDNPYKPQADLYIVSIGINEYINPDYRLSVARKDAQEFVKGIQNGGKAIFRNIIPIEIYDSQADIPHIFNALDSVATNARPNDVFIFYFAGHGATTEASQLKSSDYYLIPYDVTQVYGTGLEMEEKALSSSELLEFSRQIKAQKQLIVLDACQSGGAVKSFATRGPKEQKAMMQLARSAGVVLLAASGQEEFASEFAELGQGVFTYALLEGIRGKADGGFKDKKITVNELKGYLEDRVPELTEKYRGRPQYPTGYSRGQDFPIVIIE
ncbi:caspase family protein [Flexithrix dorotheae]|uniref:WD40 domain-containing protein n=1 Tax=Flexithrix dorotheae TaxID=70993 RepID=UPI00037A843B|nr:caspase family protein [Flexithrix dorotheae]